MQKLKLALAAPLVLALTGTAPPPAEPAYRETPAEPAYPEAPAEPVYREAPADPVYLEAPAQPATLHLTLEGLRSSDGSVRICIWSDGDGFPNCKESETVRKEVLPAAPTVSFDIPLLPPGAYAVSVIHDENDNRRLDKSFIGLPTEGVGFSNNAAVTFGPPAFAKVRFPVTGEAAQTIRMRYFL